jgi:hypothetical protein
VFWSFKSFSGHTGGEFYVKNILIRYIRSPYELSFSLIKMAASAWIELAL